MFCAYCGLEFTQNVSNQKFCSKECKIRHGTETRRNKKKPKNKLDIALEQARQEGITYEEYKRRKDLEYSRLNYERYLNEQSNTKGD